jgi:5S rRNA maturation endonuclease (ribonuclease M5)
MGAYHGLPDLETLAAILGGEVRGGEVLAPGPGHSVADRSLAVKLDANAPDGFVVYSFADDDAILCRDHVRKKIGLPKPERNRNGKTHSLGKGSGRSWTTISEHPYYDEHGKPYLKVRKCLDGAGKKQFPQYHWDGTHWGKGKPTGPKIPYRLPQLIAAPITTTIYFCEGEKDADNLARLGFTTTTASEGAAAKWDPALTRYFNNRPVVILPDADRPGRAHAEKIARAINGVAASVRVLDLYPDRHDGSDVSDWLEHDRACAKLAKLAKEASLWEPTSRSDADNPSIDSTKSDDELISQLAALPRLTYARRRKDAAKQLGVTVTDLDKVVAEARGVLKDKESASGPYPHWNVEACDEPVDGNALLGALIEMLRRYLCPV